MAVYKRLGADGRTARWQVVVDVDDGSGRRKRRVLGTFATKKAADSAERNAIISRDEGTLLEKNRMTVNELLERWLANKAANVSTNTLADYQNVIRKHIAPSPLGAMQIRRVGPADVQHQYALWTAAGKSPHLVGACHTRLGQAFTFAVKMKLIVSNPVRDATPPRQPPPPFDHWTADESRRFLAAAQSDELAPAWDILLREGPRRGEVLGLRWGDIDFEQGTMHIVQSVIYNKDGGGALLQAKTKTKAGTRTVRLTPSTLAGLRALKDRRAWSEHPAMTPAPDRLIFCTEHGGPLPPNRVNLAFARIIKRAGLRRIRLHHLRHTAASLLLLAGIPAKTVSQRLGHNDVGITLNLYSHLAPELEDHAALAMEKLLLG